MKTKNFDFGISQSMIKTRKKEFTFYDRVQQFKQMKSLLERVSEMMNETDVDLMESMKLKIDIEEMLNNIKTNK